MSFSRGQIVNNRYRIVRLLGQGGYGTVYKAWDLTFELPCALKENLKSTPDAHSQFLREARLLRKLRHPNLPQVSDYFILPDAEEGAGAAYLVMDFIDGEDLREMQSRRAAPFEETQALDWIGQICDALSYLHAQTPPVIHRDVKPANIKITPEGRAILVDFGIAKSSEPGLPTTTGARGVTAGYAPIEQYGGGGRTDARSDLYSLGATLYTLLTGQAPPESTERTPLTPLTAPRHLNPLISAHVADALLRALEFFPEERFQSVAEFKAALRLGAPASTGLPAAPASAPTEIASQSTPAPAAPRGETSPGAAASAPEVWEAPSPEKTSQAAFQRNAPAAGSASPFVQPQGAGQAPVSSRSAIPPVSTGGAAVGSGRSPRRWAGLLAVLALVGLAAALGLCFAAYRLIPMGAPSAALQPTPTTAALPGAAEPTGAEPASMVTGTPTENAAGYGAEPAAIQPVELLDGDTVTLTGAGNQYRYTILSAERQPLGAGKLRLHLRVRAWTDSGAGLNFWSDSFRLYVGDQHLAPVNNLNEIVNRDQTVDGDVDFEIDSTLKEAALVVASYGETQQLRLAFPLSGSAAQTAAAPAVPTAAIAGALPVELPDGVTVTLLGSGTQYKYTLLSAERQPLGAGKYRLHLRVRAWTDSGAGLNFWSDSFRLHVGDQTLAPVNSLNEIVNRDQTVDGDVDFEMEAGLKDAVLEISAYSTSQQLRLIFP